jgi:phosphoribosyl 1,2-cyclic phosphodiesterase
MDRLRFLSLGSGSSGNCYFFGNATHGILVDAGIGSRSLRRDLRQVGVELDRIYGVFVTHDHHDHIKAAGTLGEKFHIPVYATSRTHSGMDRSYGMTQKLQTSRRILENGQPLQVGEFTVVSFPVSHDGTDNAGFFIRYRNQGILVATDLGCVNDDVKKYLKESTIAVFESNYDPDLLREGRYPYPLKQRILSATGHLSNHEAGAFLAENWHASLRHIFLCHLSNDNNRPELASKTVSQYFEARGVRNGVDLQIVPLKRNRMDLVVFDD